VFASVGCARCFFAWDIGRRGLYAVALAPPPPYEDKYRPHHVCKLDKALYEFKQALRAWYAKFTSKLTKLGFKASKAN
jgi:hypothetical protein